jgi:hypothetical protein
MTNIKRPTSMGLAFWEAAHKMRQGGNTVTAVAVKRSINGNPDRYMVPEPSRVHFIPRELKGKVQA